MLKTYQFKTHCNSDSQSCKTAYHFARTHDKTKVNALNVSKRNIVCRLGEMSCFNQHNTV